jgi:hypothetical protein
MAGTRRPGFGGDRQPPLHGYRCPTPTGLAYQTGGSRSDVAGHGSLGDRLANVRARLGGHAGGRGEGDDSVNPGPGIRTAQRQAKKQRSGTGWGSKQPRFASRHYTLGACHHAACAPRSHWPGCDDASDTQARTYPHRLAPTFHTHKVRPATANRVRFATRPNLPGPLQCACC